MSNTLFKHFEWVVNSYGDSIDTVELRMSMDQGELEKLLTPENGVLDILPAIDIAADFFPRIKDGSVAAEVFFKKIIDAPYRLEAKDPAVGIKQLNYINKQLNEKDIVSSTYRGRYSSIEAIGNVYLRKAYISIYRNFLNCSKSDIDRNSDNYHILREPRVAEIPLTSVVSAPAAMNPVIPGEFADALKALITNKPKVVVKKPEVVEDEVVEVKVAPVTKVSTTHLTDAKSVRKPTDIISTIMTDGLEEIDHTPSSIAELAGVSSNRIFSIMNPRDDIFSLWRLKSFADTFKDHIPNIQDIIERIYSVLIGTNIEIIISLKMATVPEKLVWDKILAKIPKEDMGRSTKVTFRIDENTPPHARERALLSFKDAFILSPDSTALPAVKVDNTTPTDSEELVMDVTQCDDALVVEPLTEESVTDCLLDGFEDDEDLEFGETPLLRGAVVEVDEESEEDEGVIVGVRGHISISELPPNYTGELDFDIVAEPSCSIPVSKQVEEPEYLVPTEGCVISDKDVALRNFIRETIKSSDGNFKKIGKSIVLYLATEM